MNNVKQLDKAYLGKHNGSNISKKLAKFCNKCQTKLINKTKRGNKLLDYKKMP
jgi:hypothetical protein